MNYIQAVTKNRPGGGTALNPLYDLYTMPRNIDMSYYKDNYVNENGSWTTALQGHYIKNENGDWEWATESKELTGPQQQWAYASKGHNNPYWLANRNQSRQEEERAYGYITAKLNLMKGLDFQARLNIDRTKST